MKNKYSIKNEHIYFTLIHIIGVILFVKLGDISFHSLDKWVLGYVIIGATLLLNHFKIQLPPEGNSLSMDSAVYLACIFVFNLEITLTVLLYSSLIYFCYQRSTPWWAHFFNFSLYTIMMTGAYYTYIYLGGVTGEIEPSNLLSYAGALTVYFIINVLLISTYFFVLGRTSLLDALKGFLKGTIESYISTLLLSIILGFMLQAEPFFGLFLFLVISILLSFTFKQHFNLYQEVSNKANIDHLTGLKNHGYFKELLSETLDEVKRNKTSLSLAMIDIDDFKKYNDGNGHLQGDHLLTFFGSLLEKECSPKDYIVARYGGEEFVILMPDTTVSEASSFIDCLRKKVNDTYFEGVELLPYGCLSFSAGIMEWNSEIHTASEFLSHADQAMYYAKAQGKNNTHIYGNEIGTIDIDQPMEEMEQQLKLFLARDIYTYRHSKRVFRYAVEFGKQLDLNDYEKKVLMLGALIHDIGKLEVPRDIINKKGKLTSDEWEMVKKHVTWGRDIVAASKKYEDILPLVELHHERYDGKGYPYGLIGEEIPKLARILCVVDSFDAMTTERPYQKTKSYYEAMEELQACAGTQFDPFYVEAFIDYFTGKNESDDIREYQDSKSSSSSINETKV